MNQFVLLDNVAAIKLITASRIGWHFGKLKLLKRDWYAYLMCQFILLVYLKKKNLICVFFESTRIWLKGFNGVNSLLVISSDYVSTLFSFCLFFNFFEKICPIYAFQFIICFAYNPNDINVELYWRRYHCNHLRHFLSFRS